MDMSIDRAIEDYADEHAEIEAQLKSLGLPLPDSDCLPTTDELSAVMANEIKRLRLTNEERAAIAWAVNWITSSTPNGFCPPALLGLLRRTP